MATVTASYQNGTNITWDLGADADVFTLKQMVVSDDNSPMKDRDVDRVRIVPTGGPPELSDGTSLTDGATYYPFLKLGD